MQTKTAPDLEHLPPAPGEKSGWPWDAPPPQLPERLPDGRAWPRVSIVTPSFNQAPFLEETIRSVLLQGYPDLEYIVMDGGSTDGSVDIVRKYAPWLSFWKSEKDAGQSQAIRRGFDRAGGEILSWLNSDDMLMPGAAYFAVCYLSLHGETGMVYGDRVVIGPDSRKKGTWRQKKFFPWQLRYCCGVHQEGSFFRRQPYFDSGGLDETLHFALDYDLWWRMIAKAAIEHLPVELGMYRFHDEAKSHRVNRYGRQAGSAAATLAAETEAVQRRYLGRESTALERIALPRLRSLAWRYEAAFGRYKQKKRFLEQRRRELNRAGPGSKALEG